jgi:hypothetical protein
MPLWKQGCAGQHDLIRLMDKYRPDADFKTFRRLLNFMHRSYWASPEARDPTIFRWY